VRSGFDNLFHESVSAYPTMLIGFKGSGSLLFLGDIHDVSARRKRMRKHDLMLFLVSLSHTETDLQLKSRDHHYPCYLATFVAFACTNFSKYVKN